MASLIAAWRSITGIRYTSDAIVSVDVEAYANPNPASENGCAGVVFFLSVNGSAPFQINVVDRTLRYPRFSDYSYSPLPGASPNNHHAAVFAYGINIPLSLFPVGYLTITAIAYAANGVAYPLPDDITIYNDHDGVDRRPNSKHIYVNPATGNDSNNGSIGSPVASLHTALFLGRNNPAGTTSNDADIHGLIIHLADGLYEGSGALSYTTSNIHTSGSGWATILSDNGNARITASFFPDNSGVLYPQTYIFANGYSSSGNFRLCFQNCKFEDAGLTVRPRVNGSVNVDVWVDGGSSYSSQPRITDFSARFLERAGEPVNIAGDTGGSGKQRRFCTGHYRHHVTNGWLGWTMVMDCMMEHYTAIAFNNGGVETGQSICNVLLLDQQAYGTSPSCVALTDGYTWVRDGLKTAIVTGGAIPPGLAAVQQTGAFSTLGDPAATTSFVDALNHLIGSKTLGIYLSGNLNSGNNGVFEVIATGIDGSGMEYVIYRNPSAVTEMGRESRTVGSGSRLSQLPYNQLHPDIIQYTPNSGNHLASSLAAVDTRETQTYYSSGGGLSNVWLVNCSDGNHKQTGPYIMYGGNHLRDCGWINCTFSGRIYTSSAQPHFNNCMVNCVFDSTSAFEASPGFYADGCHWIDTISFAADDPFGTNSSSGPFHENDIAVAPFHLTPALAYLGTGVQSPEAPAEFAFAGAAGLTSKGCLSNVATLDWGNLSPSTVDPVSATGPLLSMTPTLHAASASVPRSVASSPLTINEVLFAASARVVVSTTSQLLSFAASQPAASASAPVTQTYEFTSALFPRMGFNPSYGVIPIVAQPEDELTFFTLSLHEPLAVVSVSQSSIDLFILTQLHDPTVSTIGDVVSDHLTLTLAQPPAAAAKVALAYSDDLSMLLTIPDQPQEILATADHLLLVDNFSLHEPQVRIAATTTADSLSYGLTIYEPSADVGASTTASTLSWALVQHPAEIKIPATVIGDNLDFAPGQSEPSVKIAATTTASALSIAQLSIYSASVGVAPTVSATPLTLVVDLHDGGAASPSSVVADSLTSSLSLYAGAASVGSSSEADILLATLSLHEPSVSIPRVIVSDGGISFTTSIFDSVIMTPPVASAGHLSMQLDIMDVLIPWFPSELNAPPSSEAAFRLSRDIFVEFDPALIEEWRVVFNP